MKKTIVVYSSISGFTKKYAQWIGEQLNAEVITLKKFNAASAQSAEIVIYGGNLHAVGINGFKKFKKMTKNITNKTFAVFACGASPARKETLEHVVRHNFSEQDIVKFPFFYMRGGFDFGKLDFFNKLLMSLMKWKLSGKKNRTPDEAGMLSAFDQPVDYSNVESIKDLVMYCRKING
jgi:menaquinone-dependent protoporphyrinogen IX oxidase